jgi:cytoskeletal protein CcmA (bactofilin family)
MWGDKQPQPGTPATPAKPTAPAGARVETPLIPTTPVAAAPLATPASRTTAWLGSNVTVKGEIAGDEDLRVDGKVDGPISIGGHRLTVGPTADITAEITAREVVIYGKVHGDLRARDRIEIKKDGSVTGDLTTARIVIEDGAVFKGHIEIDRSNTQVGTDLDGLFSRTGTKDSKKKTGQ